MSSLACKCVNFTDQNIIQRRNSMELNFKGLEMKKWNIATGRVQRADEKTGVICLFIMLTPQVMLIKMSKMAHFLYSLLIPAKNQWQFVQNICVSSLSQKILWIVAFWATISKISTFQDTEFYHFLLTWQFFDFSTLDVSQTVAPEPINHTIFWKNSKRSFRWTI